MRTKELAQDWGHTIYRKDSGVQEPLMAGTDIGPYSLQDISGGAL